MRPPKCFEVMDGGFLRRSLLARLLVGTDGAGSSIFGTVSRDRRSRRSSVLFPQGTRLLRLICKCYACNSHAVARLENWGMPLPPGWYRLLCVVTTRQAPVSRWRANCFIFLILAFMRTYTVGCDSDDCFQCSFEKVGLKTENKQRVLESPSRWVFYLGVVHILQSCAPLSSYL